MKLNFENFGKRFCAYFIDMAILTVFFLIIKFAIGLFMHVRPFTLAIICYALTMFYFAKMESGDRQATLGKQILGLQVVNAKTGEAISFGRALIRNVMRIINEPIFCAGYLFILFTKKNQGLHDLICRTTVVDAELDDETEEKDDATE